MEHAKPPKWLIGAIVLGTLALAGIALVALTRPQRELPAENVLPQESAAEGIRVFDIDDRTTIDAARRKMLVEKLGPDSIVHRAPVDLTIDDRRWTETNLPRIWSLHTALNPPLGERREHDVIILTYRRTQARDLPLRYVELALLADSGKPLYITLRPTDDAAALRSDLRHKYGAPTVIGATEDETRAEIWRQGQDILVAARIPRRGERVETLLRLYFTGNIEYLLAQERQAAEAEARRKSAARRSVF